MVIIKAVQGLNGIDEYLFGVGWWGKKRKYAREGLRMAYLLLCSKNTCLKTNPSLWDPPPPGPPHTHTFQEGFLKLEEKKAISTNATLPLYRMAFFLA